MMDEILADSSHDIRGEQMQYGQGEREDARREAEEGRGVTEDG